MARAWDLEHNRGNAPESVAAEYRVTSVWRALSLLCVSPSNRGRGLRVAGPTIILLFPLTAAFVNHRCGILQLSVPDGFRYPAPRLADKTFQSKYPFDC